MLPAAPPRVMAIGDQPFAAQRRGPLHADAKLRFFFCAQASRAQPPASLPWADVHSLPAPAGEVGKSKKCRSEDAGRCRLRQGAGAPRSLRERECKPRFCAAWCHVVSLFCP